MSVCLFTISHIRGIFLSVADHLEPIEAGEVTPTPRKRYNPRLSQEHKLFIVKQFAAYEKTADIVVALKEQFSIDVAKHTVDAYRYKPEWAAKIVALRKTLDAQLSDIPLSSRFYRMKERQNLYEGKGPKKSSVRREKREILTEAAKEMAAKEESEAVRDGRGAKGDHFYAVVNQFLSAPPEAVKKYAMTGEWDFQALPAPSSAGLVIDVPAAPALESSIPQSAPEGEGATPPPASSPSKEASA